jgi:hypothetical protein
VVVEYTSYEDYLTQFYWCRTTFGPYVLDGWREIIIWDEVRWKFTSEKKAMLFKLKWGHLEYN